MRVEVEVVRESGCSTNLHLHLVLAAVSVKAAWHEGYVVATVHVHEHLNIMN